MTTRVISICSLRHKDVWLLTSELLPRFVKSDEYIVYVPESEIEDFKKLTKAPIVVASQEDLGVEFTPFLEKAVLESENPTRFGWYLQQFYKFEALIRAGADKLIIWDADCVPLTEIPLFEGDVPIYMDATEMHAPYFEMIHRLLGLNRVQSQSFVIPGFPIHKEWMAELIRAIEKKHPGKSWFEAIIETTDFTQMSGFSETEILGTWVANTYPGLWKSSSLTWERLGQSKFGYARDMNPNRVVKIGKRNNIDILSFENWDVRGSRKERFKNRVRDIAFRNQRKTESN